MIQLTFQPAFDPFHAVYRLLRLRPTIAEHGPLHQDHVRILDFYLLFPFRVAGIRLMPKHRSYKRLATAYAAAKPYGDQPDDQILFSRIQPMQVAALETLASRSLIDPGELEVGLVAATDLPVPPEVAKRAERANERDGDLIDFLGTLASEYPLTGGDGVKARTGLLEHRYDAV
jgi:ABC-three component (ABC-3C) system Middle Component 5